MTSRIILEGLGDTTLQEDLEYIAGSADWEQLRGASFLITGVTGLVGANLVRALLCINRVRNQGMRIYGIARNEDKVRAIYGPLLDRPELTILYMDLLDADFIEKISAETNGIDYIIHGAAVTASRQMVTQPVETIMTAIRGTKNLLDVAVVNEVRSFVYLSSMEAYGDMSVYGSDVPAIEDRLGLINPQRVRSNYPESKRMCENLCTAYHSEYHLPVKAARLSQTFGAGIMPWEGRVFAQFARSAMHGEDIVLHTKGLSEGNYCYTKDTILGLLTILLSGKDGEAYNIANESTHMTIAEMAQVVSETLGGGQSKVVFDIPEDNAYGYAADVHLRLDAGKLRGLGWAPTVDLPEMYQRLAATIRYQEAAQ